MDRNALDWLFSTAPQALAALVGLIFAGVTFINGTIEKEIDRDNTSEDIYNDMKRDIHSKMKIIFLWAGISICFDLFLLILNPIENDFIFSFKGKFDPHLLISGIVLLLNLFTLFFSLWFIIRVANPQYFDNTVKRLSKLINDRNRDGNVEAKDFLMEFIKLEKALRELPLNLNSERGLPISLIIRELRIRELLNTDETKKIYEFNKLRNLIAHGEYIENVDKKTYNDLKESIKKIKDLNTKLTNEQ